MKVVLFALLIVLVVGAFFIGLGFFSGSNKQLVGNELVINGVTIEVEVADSIPKQIQGLSGRDGLCENCGMIFPYSAPQIQNFTMRGMKFSLDMIFIRDSMIVEIHEDLPHPERAGQVINVQTKEEADLVLEVVSGFAREHDFQIGDEVIFSD